MRHFFIILRNIKFVPILILAMVVLGPLGAQEAAVKESALVSLFVNGINLGDVEIFVGSDERLLIPATLLRRSLKDIARADIINILAEGESLVATDRLAGFGIVAAFDRANLLLTLKVPASAMPVVDFSTQTVASDPKGLALSPEPFSAILGLALQADSTYNASLPAADLNPEALLALSPSINVLGWVAEAQVDLNWKIGYQASLKSARILKDFPKSLTRLTLGLVDTQSRSFQSGIPLLGFSVGRESRLQGNRKLSGATLEEFVIEEPADITIGLNGVVVKRTKLQPGSYRLSELSLASGINDIVIGIHEDGKSQREIRRSLPWDGGLLPKGDFDWYLAAGVDKNKTDSPFGTGYAAWGLTRSLSAGLDFQSGIDSLLGGGLASWATTVGTFSTALGLSHSWKMPLTVALPSYAMSFNWQFQIPGALFAPRLGFGAKYREAGFSVPAQRGSSIASAESSPINLTMQVGQSIPGGGALALIGSTALDELGWRNAAFSLGYFQALKGSVSMSVSMGAEFSRKSALVPSFSFAVSTISPDRKTFQYHSNLVEGRDSINLSIPLGSSIDRGLSARGENLVGGAETPKNAAVGIHGPLGFLDLSSELAYARNSALMSEQLKFNGAASTFLAFAGGQLGISRSIGDSFAFLVPDESIGSQRVDLRPTGSASTTSSLGGRSKIIPNLTSYMKTGVGIDMPESPPDISPSVPAVVLNPTYRSGTVIKVSVKRSYFVYGRLKDAKGKAVVEIFGDVFKTSGEPLAVSTFTDDQGKFEYYGLEPGEYSLHWGNGSVNVFSLADTSENEIDLGDLVSGSSASMGIEAEGSSL